MFPDTRKSSSGLNT